MDVSHPWETYLKHCLLYGNPALVAQMSGRRAEAASLIEEADGEYSEEERKAADKIRKSLEARVG